MYKNTVVATCEPVESVDIKCLKDESEMTNVHEMRELPEYMDSTVQKCCVHLNEYQVNEVKALLYEYLDIFSKGPNDIGCTDLATHEINTGAATPVKQHPRRLPFAKREIADNEIKKMIDQNIIEPASSPWNSNIVLVIRPGKEPRFCLDYRGLNQDTIKDSHALPRIDETLDALNGSQWFSTLDLKSGYWQVPIKETDKCKTAFSVLGGGMWQFKVMPFGLTNAPATFERLMEKILAGLSRKVCMVYLDDIIVFSKSFRDQLENLKQVFQKLRESKLKLSPKKCVLFQRQVSFLGHIISSDGVASDPSKISCIKEWPVPKNVKEIRSFLGLCSYYRRFVKGFSNIAKSLHKLTKKNEKFRWTREHKEAFESYDVSCFSLSFK